MPPAAAVLSDYAAQPLGARNLLQAPVHRPGHGAPCPTGRPMRVLPWPPFASMRRAPVTGPEAAALAENCRAGSKDFRRLCG